LYSKQKQTVEYKSSLLFGILVYEREIKGTGLSGDGLDNDHDKREQCQKDSE
jgi:hypothetical protein